MKITSEMLAAAVDKAVEARILPRNAYPEDIATNAEIMRDILEAALACAPQENEWNAPAPQRQAKPPHTG